MIRAEYFGNTDVGNVRKRNEDTFYVAPIPGTSCILAMAVDGVGGYAGGDVAAKMARDTIVDFCNSVENPSILDAVIAANNKIYDARKEAVLISQMSCVLSAAIIDLSARKVMMAHVGDTRLYEYLDGQLQKLSHDHSVVGFREEIGELTEEEAMHHPNRNVISKVVGMERISRKSDYVEYAEFPLIPGATLLFCSDGLCDMITSQQMVDVLLREDLSVEEKTNALIDEAKLAGGRDNVTVVLVAIEGDIEDMGILVEDSPRKEGDETDDDSGAKVATIWACVLGILGVYAILAVIHLILN